MPNNPEESRPLPSQSRHELRLERPESTAQGLPRSDSDWSTEEELVVRMAVIDGITMGHAVSPRSMISREVKAPTFIGYQHCAKLGDEPCTSPPANFKSARFCLEHQNLETLCGITGCDRPVVEGTAACGEETHAAFWRSWKTRFQGRSMHGVKRAIEHESDSRTQGEAPVFPTPGRLELPAVITEGIQDIPLEDAPANPTEDRRHISEAQDEPFNEAGEDVGEPTDLDTIPNPAHISRPSRRQRDVKHSFQVAHVYCVQVISWACGIPIAFRKMYISESEPQVFQCIDDIWPEELKDQRPSYISYDRACKLLSHIITSHARSS